MSHPRQVISGVGIVSCHGPGLDRLWDSLLSTGSGFATDRTRRLRSPYAVASIPETTLADSAHLRTLGRSARILLSAAESAFEDARLARDDRAAPVRGVIVGSGFTPALEGALAYGQVAARGPMGLDPWLFDNALHGNLALELARIFHADGMTVTVSCGPGGATGATAVAAAARFVRAGAEGPFICGGVDGLVISEMPVTDRTSRPFDIHSGYAQGEAACALIVEDESPARARGAQPHASIQGWGEAAVIDESEGPDRTLSMVEAMATALDETGLEPGQIGLVICDGSGDHELDQFEVAALAAIFADRPGPPLFCLTGSTGYCHAGSGAMAIAIAAAILACGIVPPIPGLIRPAGGSGLNFVIGMPQPATSPYALINAVSGAGACSIVIKGMRAE